MKCTRCLHKLLTLLKGESDKIQRERVSEREIEASAASETQLHENRCEKKTHVFFNIQYFREKCKRAVRGI